MEHMGSTQRYDDLQSYCDANPQLKERWIAAQLEIDPARFSKLKSRKYGLRPSDAEVDRLAELLNQPRQYVRKLYKVAA